jgi:hypothetical protein
MRQDEIERIKQRSFDVSDLAGDAALLCNELTRIRGILVEISSLLPDLARAGAPHESITGIGNAVLRGLDGGAR